MNPDFSRINPRYIPFREKDDSKHPGGGVISMVRLTKMEPKRQ